MSDVTENTDCPNKAPRVVTIVFDGDEDRTLQQGSSEAEVGPAPEDNGALQRQVTICFEDNETATGYDSPPTDTSSKEK